MKKQLLLVAFILLSHFSFGCSCIGKNKLKSALKQYDVVVAGKILSKRTFTVPYLEEKGYEFMNRTLNEFTISILKCYKGKITSDTFKITTGLGHGDCGSDFTIGETYIIYSKYEDRFFEDREKVTPFLYTHICTRNCLYNEQESRKTERVAKRLKYM